MSVVEFCKIFHTDSYVSQPEEEVVVATMAQVVKNLAKREIKNGMDFLVVLIPLPSSHLTTHRARADTATLF